MIYTLLLCVVLLSPLPFGSVPGWSWATVVLLIGILLSAWSAAVLLARQQVAAVPPSLLWAAIPFVTSIGWGVLQTQPWFAASLAHPMWASVASALGREIDASISLDPVAGNESLLRLLAYGGVFWLALQAARDRRRAHTMTFAIATSVAVYALYGLAVQLSGSNSILWFDKIIYRDVVTGPFIRRSTFATFAGLGLLCATALLLHGLRDAAYEVASVRERTRLSLIYLFSGRGIILLACWFVISVALLLSESRAGSAATAGSLSIFLAVILARGGGARRMAGKSAAIMALAVVLIFYVGGAGLDQRLTSIDTDLQTRLRYDDGTIAAIRDSPWIGTGLGSFESVFRFYDTGGAGRSRDKAQNDYLELTLELGLPAATAFVLSLAVLTTLCALGAVRRRRDETIAATGVAASVLVGVHSMVEPSLHTPAVALTYSLILGIATAQSWSSRD